MRFLHSVCAVGVLSLAVNCGGADHGDLFGASAGEGGTSTGGTASGGTASGGTASGGTASGGTASGGTSTGGTATGGTATGGTATGGTATGGTATGGASTGGTASGGTASGGTATGGTASGGTASGGTATGGTGPGADEVVCGDQVCEGVACCLKRELWGAFNMSCADPGTDCGEPGWRETEITCDGPEDCPNDTQCCGMLRGDSNQTAYYESLICVDVCNDGDGEVTVCGEHPGLCPDGTECGQSALLPEGYNVCRTN